MERKAEIIRNTKETQIELKLNLDGEGRFSGATGIGFLDHMFTLLAKHGFLDIELKCTGDLEVDTHHTVEDLGIALGQAIDQAIGSKQGITRYGNSFVPMDEALLQVCLDLSGRPFLVWDVDIPVERVGEFETEMTVEFFQAIANNAKMNLHVRMLSGENGHHIIEGAFKAFGRALAEAVSQDPRVKGVLSTKGTL